MRLTRFQYNNTLRDLFGELIQPTGGLELDVGFERADTVTVDLVVGYADIARKFAVTSTQSPEALAAITRCAPAAVGDDCARTFIGNFVGKVFRHPADAADAQFFGDVFATGQMLGGNFASGVRAVIEVALQSPEFLYRVEFGEKAGSTDLLRPTPYEMATRLSYALWGSTPDDPLLGAAAAGELRIPQGVEAHAKRMLDDVRAQVVAARFVFDLLYIPIPDSLESRGLEKNPGFHLELAKLFRQETETFVGHALVDGNDFNTLLTAPYTWANGPLATFY
ncbi:MAG TPA: DUF1592 domain-containing protein, partial [Polyangiaceae bacterium]|nr:DUF1592 domain-containing protein [Polyangiaceae bacterium]